MADRSIPARLNVITLGVHDLPRLRGFYVALGWKPHSAGDDWCRFETGGATLALFPLERLADEAGLPPSKEGDHLKGSTLAMCVEERDHVDAAIERVREAGGRILAEPVDREWGGRSGYFSDPENNAWEIAWLPGATFDPSGAMRWPS